MKKCNYCQVEVADFEMVCPLCRTALEVVEKEPCEPTYPVIRFDTKKFHLLMNSFLFLAVALGLTLIVVNVFTFHGLWWSFISTGVIIYACVTLLFSVQHNTNPAAKILVQTLLAQVLAVLIDVVIGYQGWSVNYAVPGILLLADASMLVLMIVNFMNWQSYILFQIEYVLFSLIPVVLAVCGVITRPLLTVTALVCSVLILAGTMIFGDRKAKNELIRRFHI